MVGRAVQRAFHERRPAIVATFDPHPVRFFKPDLPPFRLTTLDQRQALFAHAGADAMLVFEFGGELASTERRGFRRRLLGRQIGAAGVVTGDDFSFGKGRRGDVPLLERWAPSTASPPKRWPRSWSTANAFPPAGSATR